VRALFFTPPMTRVPLGVPFHFFFFFHSFPETFRLFDFERLIFLGQLATIRSDFLSTAELLCPAFFCSISRIPPSTLSPPPRACWFLFSLFFFFLPFFTLCIFFPAFGVLIAFFFFSTPISCLLGFYVLTSLSGVKIAFFVSSVPHVRCRASSAASPFLPVCSFGMF